MADMTQSGYSAAAPGPVDSEGHVSGIRVGNPATGHSNSMGKDEMPNCGEEARWPCSARGARRMGVNVCASNAPIGAQCNDAET